MSNEKSIKMNPSCKDNMNRRHSLIIVPPEQLSNELQILIEEYNERYNASDAIMFKPHVTVKSLGIVGVEPLKNEVLLQIENIAENAEPFCLSLSGLRFYGSTRNMKGIYIPVQRSHELLSLHKDFVGSIKTYDGKDRSFKEGLKFNPHLTLVGNDITIENYERAEKELQDVSYSFRFIADKITLISRIERDDGFRESKSFQYLDFNFKDR